MEQQISDTSHCLDVLARLNEFRKHRKYCDFTIKCGTTEIPVHKCLVAASSDYFDAMLSHDTKENQDGFVNMVNIDEESVVKCVEFMYTGESSIPTEKQAEIIYAARLFQLQKLYDGVVSIMEKHLDGDSFFSSRLIAIRFGFKSLLERCDEFAVHNFHVVMKRDEFKDLKASYVESLLSSNELNVSDDVKCKALMNWVDNDAERTVSLFSLMEHLDIKNVQVAYRRYLLDTPIIFNTQECLEYVMSSMPQEASAKSADYDGVCNPSIIFANTRSRRLERFDLEKKSWTEMQPLMENTATRPHSMALLDTYLYLIDWGHSMVRLKLNEKEAIWEKLLPPMHGFNGPITICNRILYMTNHFEHTRNLAQYDPALDRWSILADKKFTTQGSCMAACSGKVYVISGMDEENQFPREVECYDTDSSSWTTIEQQIQQGRKYASACTHNHRIYIFGGRDNQRMLNTVDILLGTGSVFLMLYGLCRKLFLSHNLCGKIYVVGGDWYEEDYSEYPSDEKSIAIFDPKENHFIDNDEIYIGEHANDFTLGSGEPHLNGFASVAVVM